MGISKASLVNAQPRIVKSAVKVDSRIEELNEQLIKDKGNKAHFGYEFGAISKNKSKIIII